MSKAASAVIRQTSQTRDEVNDAIAKGKAVPAAIQMTEHLMSVEEGCKHHGTNYEKGLSDQQVKEKLANYGKNELTPPPSTPMWLLFIHHLTGFFSLLLWVAGILCFISYAIDDVQVENLYLGIVLVTVVILTGCFSFFQDFKSAAIMEGFKNFLPEFSRVRRNGIGSVDVESNLLVPGDIVIVKSGEAIPADLRVCEAANFKVDNSSLTGESEPQKRKVENIEQNPLEATNVALYGTNAVSGNCIGLVTATGDNTIIGKIANLAAGTETTETPISIEIHEIGLQGLWSCFQCRDGLSRCGFRRSSR